MLNTFQKTTVQVTNNLTVFFLDMFKKDTSTLPFLFESYVPKDVLLSTYKALVYDKSLVPIEYLPVEEKIKLVEQCKETGIKFDNRKLTSSARILHTLKFINENV